MGTSQELEDGLFTKNLWLSYVIIKKNKFSSNMKNFRYQTTIIWKARNNRKEWPNLFSHFRRIRNKINNFEVVAIKNVSIWIDEVEAYSIINYNTANFYCFSEVYLSLQKNGIQYSHR